MKNEIIVILSILSSILFIAFMYIYFKYYLISVVDGCYYPTNKTICINADLKYSDYIETANHEYLHYKIEKEHWCKE